MLEPMAQGQSVGRELFVIESFVRPRSRYLERISQRLDILQSWRILFPPLFRECAQHGPRVVYAGPQCLHHSKQLRSVRDGVDEHPNRFVSTSVNDIHGLVKFTKGWAYEPCILACR